MSGQPLRNPTDAAKFRKAYMATLNLQQELNKKVFDANALYKRTGVVPTQITDYRSTTEKLADIINLRILIRSQLRQIADAQNAEDIAQSLSADQLVFLSQNIDAIIKDLKPKNKFGVLKDIFMKYLDNYITKEQANQLASVGLPDTNRPDRSAPSVNLPEDMVQREEYVDILAELEAYVKQSKSQISDPRIADFVLRGIDIIKSIIPDRGFFSALEEVEDPTIINEIKGYLASAEEDIPNPAELGEALRAMKDTPDMEELVLVSLGEKLGGLQEGLVQRQMADAVLSAAIAASRTVPRIATRSDLYDQLSDVTTAPTDLSYRSELPPIPFKELGEPDASHRRRVMEYFTGLKVGKLREITTIYKKKDAIKQMFTVNTTPKENLLEALEANYNYIIRLYLEEAASQREREEPGGDTGRGGEGYTVTSYSPPSRTNADQGGASAQRRAASNEGVRGFAKLVTGKGYDFDELIAQSQASSALYQADTEKYGTKMALARAESRAKDKAGRYKGLGFRKNIKGRGMVDYSKGIEPLPKFAPLGNYYINLQKLKDDVITCCRSDGKNLNTWKARRVSLPLANLIRKLVEKGKPTFDEMSALSDEDKHILGDFIRKAKLEIDIPNSKIDREDLSKFEIMKGQILSGQDNKEYIKEFKLLIVKLCNEGRLPKGQSKELLMDLATLGY